MNSGKARRQAYRARLKGQGPNDRFSDMMRAVTGGGARPCRCCRIVRSVSTLDGNTGVCRACADSIGRIRLNPPEPRPVQTHKNEPGVIWVDASFDAGVAGIAIVGELGIHVRKVDAMSSVHAETLALRWAMAIARAADLHDLTFRTDCQAAAKMFHWGTHRMGWTVEQIPRSKNHAADRLAWDARLAA